MKTFFNHLLKVVQARTQKNIVYQNSKNPAHKLNPAPSYWLLVPVHPNDAARAKCSKPSPGNPMFK
jgi:hypothetical protein